MKHTDITEQYQQRNGLNRRMWTHSVTNKL